MLSIAVSRLAAEQDAQGGWGWRTGGAANTECTALATLALQAHGRRDAAHRGYTWLQSRQRTDGSWPLLDAVPESSWTTSLAVLTASAMEPDGVVARRGSEWLLRQKSRRYSLRQRIQLWLNPSASPVEQDPDLIGWPWRDGAGAWVEPTSWALIAIKQPRNSLPRRAVRDRIEQAEALLYDRMCVGGGWNYGNRTVRGVDLDPYADTTAIALMALQDRGGDAGVKTGLDRLPGLLAATPSLLALSLGILSLQLHGEDVSQLRSGVADRLAAAGGVTDARAHALGLLALVEDSAPFRADANA